MKKQKETFASLISSFAYQYDVRTVFDDFLTMAICAFSQNPLTRKSYDEDLYLETIAKYKDKKFSSLFPKMLTCLTLEMEDRFGSSAGHDVLGEYYEQHLFRKGASQYFTPWPICMLMAQSISSPVEDVAPERRLRILDPCCGSGRMLLAAARKNGQGHHYFGIDIDLVCVKMTAINFFLSGLFHSEVLCSDALDPDDFRVSYKISFLPFGIFRITEKERSMLWHLKKNSFHKPSEEILPPQVSLSKAPDPNFKGGTQLKLL